ncbi:SH3 domain-containing kinase-binding protein 1-like isoform X3 [Ostrea edulis]|uniref:SH3 domain-containing kinase-binding protein 1-like isoform X3 n=1 Tax=Ostrea edulis TaxID=37623 RepID=UPI0024AEDC0E|nr:SH3 domain-containing kinase-binding protein 1-like isoform X3 [Ostrea edulis]
MKNRILFDVLKMFLESIMATQSALLKFKIRVISFLDQYRMETEDSSAVEKAVVRYSYSADNEDELSLKENEVLTILDKDLEDAGWWRGELNGKIGVFPDNFVELIPTEEGIDKFTRPWSSNKIPPQPKPKKPPPPSVPPSQQKTKSLEKEKSLDHKHPPVTDHVTDKFHKKKETEPEKTGPPHLPGKKPVLPPPVGKKPAKPDPPRPTSDGKSHMVGGSKDEPVSHKDTHKDIPQNESHFDGLEPTSDKLVHLTANRPRGPAKRPPSQVIFNNKNNKRLIKEEERNGDIEVQTPKHPPPVKEISEEPPVQHFLPREKHQTLPTRPPEPSVASSGLLAMVEELKKEIRELKSNSVSKAAYDELKTENNKLRQDFETFKTSCSRKIRDLINEVDDEKKIRLSTEVEVKRIKKLINDESHV